MSEKKAIFSALLRSQLSPGNHPFGALLKDLAITHLGKPPIEAERFAERNLRKYWNWLLALIDEHRGRGLNPYYIIPSMSSFAITCAGYDLSISHDAESQLLGANLRSRATLLKQIDALNDRRYEALSGLICEAIGAEQFVLTPPGNEGGIDFFAHIIVRKNLPMLPALGTHLRVVGQCKKYTSALTVDKFEQFVQTMHNVRYRSERVRRHIPSWFNESRAPIVGWMIAHDGFQTGAADEGKQHGIYLSDSIDLAELLCQYVTLRSASQDDLLRLRCDSFL